MEQSLNLSPTQHSRWMRRAHQVARLVGMVPFVRYVGLNGSLARGCAHQGSDIDFFVLVEHGHLWSTRLAVSAILQLAGLRRIGHRIAGRICLNRFFSTHHLSIAPHTLGNAQTFAAQIPLYDSADWHHSFVRANQWVEEFGYRFAYRSEVTGVMPQVKLSFERALLGKFGTWLEQIVRAPQYARIAADLRTADPNGRVVFSDYELTFNPPKLPTV